MTSRTLSGGAFTRHMREAIALNRERLPRYAALTEGRSKSISRRLVRSERLSLPAAMYVDRRALLFQAAGVRIVEDDFVPMHDVPEFREAFDPPDLDSYARQAPRPLVRRLRRAWEAGDFSGLRDAAHTEIERLAGEPRFHCMLRHLLESLRRIAHLAPRHDDAARTAGVGSTRDLSTLMLRMHLWPLPASTRLDHRAAPLQAEGIPILFQDLPPIPIEP